MKTETDRPVDTSTDAAIRYASAMKNITFPFTQERGFQHNCASLLLAVAKERDELAAKVALCASAAADYSAGIHGSTECMFAIVNAIKDKEPS